MKNHFFYHYFLIILVLFVTRIEAYTQDDCNLLSPDSCDPPVAITLEDMDGVFQIDNVFIDKYLADQMLPNNENTQIELLIPAGEYVAASFENLDYCRTTITLEESGDVTFAGYNRNNNDPRKPTIQLLNCHNLELDGHGIKVLDAYGTGVLHGPNESAVYIGEVSSYIDVHHLDIQNPSGFAGIMAKDSPGCVNGVAIYVADANVPFMHHIYIHHNYIHNIPQGEGVYAGDTAFMTGRNTGNCGILYPQKIENVCIYSNFIEETGLDAIQLGSCITGGRIYDNFCVEYGTLGDGGMSNGIQIGLGNIGTICERNFIRQGAERSENFGNGILCQGAGNNCIQNNIVYNTLESAIYGLEQTTYDGGVNTTGHQFIDDDILAGLTGVSIIHNTLMYPAKSVNPNITIFGIRVTPFRNPPLGGAVKNNLIFGTSEINGVDIYNGAMITCNDNEIISEDWKTVRDQYLDSSGAFDIPNDAPYATAMEAYFTTPAISEEDNFFRSPTDFYPVHPDITDNATDECAGTCESGEDFFGTARSVSEGCANDYGAVELTFPVFTISEDCEGERFSIHPADLTGTFSWVFYDESSTDFNPDFINPGVGIHPLIYTYTNDCTTVSGTLDIELTCSCRCEGLNAINIDAGEGTSWQDTEIMGLVDTEGNMLDLNNRCLGIRGRLLIDDYMSNELEIDLYIKNGFIRMQPGAEIVVQDGGGLRIQDVNAGEGEIGRGIHGCDYMWEGIDVEEGGRIIVENSIIQDASTAIGITGSADIKIQDSRFENNYRGIDIAPLIDLAANDPALFSLTVHPNGLSGNFFGTVGNGLKGTVDPTYIPAGTRGDVGVKMAYLNLGFIQGDFANTFENLRHGVYANQGFLVVKGSIFRQVDYGARLYNTAAVFLDNRFEDVALRGIESPNTAGLWAANNVMENMHQRGINCEGSANSTSYRLYDNRIAAQDHCINIEASTKTWYFDVSDNSLTLLPTTGDEVFPGRAALRVFNVGNPTLNMPIARINNHATDPITINSYGNGIVLENMSNTVIQDNEVVYQGASDELIASDGIHLANSPDNYLYGNAVQAVGDFPNVRNIFLTGSPGNELYCNSTDGGGIGVDFFGICQNTDLKTTTIGSHDIGLRCNVGTIIGLQDHQGNTWPINVNDGSEAAEHRGSLFDIEESLFRVEGSPGSEYWPSEELISIPNALEAVWFEESAGNASLCEDNTGGLPTPGDDPLGGKESDKKVAEGDYATGNYAVVHNWETKLDLFDRLEKNESLRNSESWYQSFYAQANTNEVGDYVRIREQFKDLLSLSDEEHQSADALQTSIQDNLEALSDIGKAYSQASTEADSTTLEAAWLEQYAKLSENFANWHQLSADVRQRMESGIPALQSANTALPESIVPAANEKLMNTIQLQRTLGEPLSEKQQTGLHTLAFSCPLEAGNAVYRARSILRTIGNYVFDDATLCQLGKEEEKGKKIRVPDVGAAVPQSQWQIYPNPAKHQLWIAGSQMDKLQSIQLFNSLGSPVLHKQNEGDTRMEIQLPPNLPTGVYFLHLQLRNGEMQTQKILLQP